MNTKADLAKIVLLKPACTAVDEKISLSRKVDNKLRLIGMLIDIFILHRVQVHLLMYTYLL